MPGMMTGQILGGQSPSAAAAYQIMIYFAIAASSCSTAMLLAMLVIIRMFDLRRQALIPWRLIPGLRKSKSSDDEIKNDDQLVDPQQTSELRTVGIENSEQTSAEPLLRVQQLTVESTNLHVPFLEVNCGDRIGVSGRSGIGKSQLFRTIARLDPLPPTIDAGNMIFLSGQSWIDMSPSQWRSHIMWVSQDGPTISGTPREFYSQVLVYRSCHKLGVGNRELAMSTPMNITKEWNLPVKAWDQQWNDLSGGEAQRISLSIAISLEPKLLLLDEPTSSCDADTTKKIEKTLIARNVTALMVSHSEEQLNRFCTKKIELAYVS